jgi:transcriptional regulator with XRE-family HTH domain
MISEVDRDIGRRVRRRRRLLGLTQLQLGSAVGMRLQQIQKYESGVNRVTAGKLFQIAAALEAPMAHFFEGQPNPVGSNEPEPSMSWDPILSDVLDRRATIELVRAFAAMGEIRQRKLLDFAKELLSTAA